MLRKHLLLLAGLVAAPTATMGLGLGNLQSSSALNEPFEGRIALIGATRDELDSLRLSLAEAAEFERAGVPFTAPLARLRFELVSGEGGGDYIRVYSREALREPFLNFLLAARWSAGRFVREYTVLLDPPLYDTGRSAPTVAAPDAQPATAAPAPAPAPAATRPERWTVRPGDSLWGIAGRVAAPGVSRQQMMAALLRENPGAFVDGNMNLLKSGAVLRVPGAEGVREFSRGAARELVRAQQSEWEARRGQPEGGTPERLVTQPATAPAAPPPDAGDESAGQLKLVSPADVEQLPADGGGPAVVSPELALANEQLEASRAENADLATRLAQAEKLLGELQRMMDLRSDQMAAMQARLAAAETGAAVPGAAESAEAGAATPPTTPPTPAAESGAERAIATGETLPEGVESLFGAELAAEPPAPPPLEADEDLLAALTEPLDTGAGEGGTDGTQEPDPGVMAALTEPLEQTPVDAAVAESSAPPAAATPGEAQPAPAAAAGAPAAAAPAPAPATPSPAAVGGLAGVAATVAAVLPPAVVQAIPGGALTTLGIVVVLVLVVLWLLVRGLRSRKPVETKAAAAKPADAPAATTAAALAAAAQAGSAGGLEAASEQRERPVEGLELTTTDYDARPESGPTAVPAPQTETGTATEPETERTLGLDAPPAAEYAEEEDDPLAEVNLYLAYERFDQAAALVERAIEENPDEHRLKLRLLEVYYSSTNKPAYEQAARALHDAVGGQGPLWDSAVAMWQEMSPARPLFAAPTGAVADESRPAEARRNLFDVSGESAPQDEPLAQTLALVPGESDDSEAAAGLDLDEATAAEGDDFLDFDLGDTGMPGEQLPASEAPTVVLQPADLADDSLEFDITGLGEMPEGGVAAGGGAGEPRPDASLDEGGQAGGDLPDLELDLPSTAGTGDGAQPGGLEFDAQTAVGLDAPAGEAPGVWDLEPPTAGLDAPDASAGELPDALEPEPPGTPGPDRPGAPAAEPPAALELEPSMPAGEQPGMRDEEAPAAAGPDATATPAGSQPDGGLELEPPGAAAPDGAAPPERPAERDAGETLAWDAGPDHAFGPGQTGTQAQAPASPAEADSPSDSTPPAPERSATPTGPAEAPDAHAGPGAGDLPPGGTADDARIGDTLILDSAPGATEDAGGMQDLDGLVLDDDEASLEELSRALEGSLTGIEPGEGDNATIDLDATGGLDFILDGEPEAPPEPPPGEQDHQETLIIPRPDRAFSQTQYDEAETKLSLAKAYLEIGDVPGARNILEEVVREGSDAQRNEAQRVLGNLV